MADSRVRSKGNGAVKRDPDVIAYRVYRLRQAETEEELEDVPLSSIFVLEEVPETFTRNEQDAIVDARLRHGKDRHRAGYIIRGEAMKLSEATELEEKQAYVQQRRAWGLSEES